MLDLNSLREQFDGFDSYQKEQWEATRYRLQHALQALSDSDPDWENLRDRIAGRKLPWLVAGLRAAPAGRHACGPRPTPVTVVASDGSQIYPDRHFEPTCYLLNVSRVAFHYGTVERPLMESVPFFKYRKNDLESYLDAFETATAQVISAVRDQLELAELLKTAIRARAGDRPLVAISDGTLIRWMVSGLGDKRLEKQLIAEYVQVLAQFEAEAIPLCSYISMPRNTEVVNLLRFSLGECDGGLVDARDSLAGLTDRQLFEATLSPGERSACFEAESHVLSDYGPNRICYFYLHVGDEVGRVEIPQWIAEREEVLGLIHTIVLNECEKGSGYPMILSEAHEQAVVRAQEREVFYQLVEREMNLAGLPALGSRKQFSKRRPAV
ncbi:MAG TPA: DNA double-strand break repair nuclease NurA [Rhodothermales bacterium]|nr:DNA double-strand break repair nuclease NurA [Rhodothermales bacterium]